MEALDRIPYELLSIINAYAADWVSLESLLQVSPRVGEIFAGDTNTEADYEAVRLVESILQENSVMRHELHCHFRMALKLRQPSLKSSSLTDFISQDHSSSLTTSTSSICPGKLKEMVSVAANIQRLACACLTTLLGRVRKVQPRCWKRRASDGTEPYQPREAGSPTWIEEYRVYRALWNLQLYSDLSTAGKRLGWLHDDLENWWFGHMRWDEVPVMVGEEVRTVSECLETLCEGDPILRTTKAQVTKFYSERHSFDIQLISQLPNASQLCRGFEVWAPPLLPEIPVTDDGYPLDPWGWGLRSLRFNRMAAFFRVCQLRTTTHPAMHQVCQIQDAGPWRGLGMPIWDLWRCYCLGLHSARHNVPGRYSGPLRAPDGSVVPEGCSPPTRGFEEDYRYSVFMHARTQMQKDEFKEMELETQNCIKK
ncbi:hypothetical protein AnigIFM63604_000627 [Aspergillus niger]|uniref:F-box domain-containing protein n=1 Tax=Aspergillus niger TaxID=5061 RepID=A0A9W6A9X6_ASPNG|nr:hypothetical protein AnigIFM63604_000627 [Aspergillus niger]